jgi:hypothetical protein
MIPPQMDDLGPCLFAIGDAAACSGPAGALAIDWRGSAATPSFWSFRPLRMLWRSPDGSPWERAGALLFALMLLVGCPVAVNRAVHGGGADLRWFCSAGRYILEHGTRDPKSNLGRYWPSLDVPWMIVARVPIAVTASLWYLLGCLSWIALLDAIYRYVLTDADLKFRRQATLAAGLLVMPLAIDGLCLGSFHTFMVWLMLVGLCRALRGQTVRGGLLLGVAAWLKLLPFLGAAFLFLHRKPAAALTAILAALTIDVVLSVGAFGVNEAWRQHVIWWQRGAAGTADRQLTSPGYVDEDRLTNQSVAVTVRRLLSSLGSEPGSARNCVRIADLSGPQLKLAFSVLMAVLLLGVGLFCWPRGPEPPRASAQIAMIVLATLWFSPVVWSYHLTAATPALAIVLARCRNRRLATALLVAAWLTALGLLCFPVVRAVGILLWLSLLTGAALVGLRSREEGVRS